jgi:hypothetical protein
MKNHYDCLIIGAGAAGLMTAMTAGKRNKSVCIIEHNKKPAEKIRISGGGRCNFINIHQSPQAYLSNNLHFCKSALSQYTQNDFIELVKKHQIPFHEKTLGQLFCDKSANDIINMFLKECYSVGVELLLEAHVIDIVFKDNIYNIIIEKQGIKISITALSLVVATGGLSIPKMGATDFGYRIAQQFDIKLTHRRAGLVPLIFSDDLLDYCKSLAGLSIDAIVSYNKISFQEGLLFTHRGLSGPSILQISSYWQLGDVITINLLPYLNVMDFLKFKKQTSKQDIKSVLMETALPKRLIEAILEKLNLFGRIAEMPDTHLKKLADNINNWQVKPAGTEGYRTAEVTLGGIDTNELSSKTMEAKKQNNLYFVGEVIDVTGHLGGFNFGWAWASGFACGQHIN